MKYERELPYQPHYPQYDLLHQLNQPLISDHHQQQLQQLMPQNPHIQQIPQGLTQHPNPAAPVAQGPHPEMLPSMRPPYEGHLPQLNAYGIPPPKNVMQPFQSDNSVSPAWATNQPMERARLRVNKACDRCRLHKTKCTGTFPCANCTKHGIECNFRTTAEEPPMKKTKTGSLESPEAYAPNVIGPTEDFHSQALPIVASDNKLYTAYLENRVHYLENLLLQNLNQTFKNVVRVNSDVQDINDFLKLTLSKWRFSRRHQNALVIELCKLLYEGLPPESKAKVLLPRTQYFGWNMLGCSYLKPEHLPPSPDMAEMPDNGKHKYVDFFFREINPLFAILHETVFREQLRALEKLADSDVHNTDVTALFSSIVCLVCALSIRFTEFMKPEGPSLAMLKLEERLFKYSHRVVLIFSFEWESFELIQCWLLITLYLRISHRQTSANFALGHAITMTRSMGLGRTTQVTADVKPYEMLKARRIFYSVYCFDRILGLQGGRYRALNDSDVTRAFPTLDFEKESERDDWITLPAFAMIQIARVANFIHTSTSDNYDLIKSQQIDKEIHLLQKWLSQNGFDDARDIFPVNGTNNGLSSLVKTQVKLHFYDLLIAVHGKLLFNYLGKRIASEGMKIEHVVLANEGIVFLLTKVERNGFLYAPWHSVLLLLFNVGINSLVFINAGVFLPESRRLLKESMMLLDKLQKSPVTDDAGEKIFHERFKMVRECIWALKMSNHIMALSFRESLAQIEDIGTDHESSDVNKQYFSQFGLQEPEKTSELEKLMEDQNKRNFTERTKTARTADMSTTVTAQPNSDEFSGDDLVGNLRWFDKWLDFSYDL